MAAAKLAAGCPTQYLMQPAAPLCKFPLQLEDNACWLGCASASETKTVLQAAYAEPIAQEGLQIQVCNSVSLVSSLNAHSMSTSGWWADCVVMLSRFPVLRSMRRVLLHASTQQLLQSYLQFG